MEDMKVPTRPAPKPPDTGQIQERPFRTSNIKKETFPGVFKLTRSKSTGKLGATKKPPPRPPPPPSSLLKNSKPSSSSYFTNQKPPTQFLSNTRAQTKPALSLLRSASEHSSVAAKQQTNQSVELIDFNSPHVSPTFTSHSNSDNFSLNSFGSDGTFTVNSGSSHVESGFEDDFDLLTISSSTTTNFSDPWGDGPFSSKQTNNQPIAPFTLSNEDPRCRHKDSSNVVPPTVLKPTIIRPKSSKPARPPPPRLRPASTPPKFISSAVDVPSDWSPPMPSCPPPPPPPEALAALQNGPELPPRPTSLTQENVTKKKPYCVALYDYISGHPDDLSFKVNDVVLLTEKVNDDWMRGCLDGREGMFPVSYTNVVVPIEDHSRSASSDSFKHAIALFTFRAETWDDLPFEEGETIKVTRRINNHWLYGECNGKQGQFPENYVSDVSSIFPLGTNFS